MQSAPTLPAGQPLLVADKVSKIYRSGDVEVPALVDLDLTVGVGELVAVMGPSGSGKTTLLNCLSGLDDIDAGHVRVAGRDLFAMSDADRTEHRARSMGFVFQSFNLIPVFTAVENVELPLLLVGTSAKKAHAAAVDMLGQVGLAHREDHLPNQMSGGEQQRVTIARALVATAGDRVGRRAHRQPRHRDGRADHGAAARAQRAARADDRARHPRPADRRGRRPPRAHARRPPAEGRAPRPHHRAAVQRRRAGRCTRSRHPAFH